MTWTPITNTRITNIYILNYQTLKSTCAHLLLELMLLLLYGSLYIRGPKPREGVQLALFDISKLDDSGTTCKKLLPYQIFRNF